MYNNEPFEEYIRQVLGYHNIEKSTNNDFTNNNYNYLRTNENELENYYPEIYKIVYPLPHLAPVPGFLPVNPPWSRPPEFTYSILSCL